MTEAEWLEGTNPTEMLRFVDNRTTQRKLQLFACACCRRIWHTIGDAKSQRAIEFAESQADSETGHNEIENEVSDQARAVYDKALSAYGRSKDEASKNQAYIAIVGARAVSFSIDQPTQGAIFARDGYSSWKIAEKDQTWLLREFFGNPFDMVVPAATWLTPTVVQLAQAAYVERQLPSGYLEAGCIAVLADALEEAGCRDETILAHCRTASPHFRGCWVIDLLLGKA